MIGGRLVDELRDRALRAAQEAETSAQRRRRTRRVAAEANSRSNRLIREADDLCRTQFGVSADWYQAGNGSVCAYVEGVLVSYRGKGELSHNLASLGREIAAQKAGRCDLCIQKLYQPLSHHIKYDCRKAPFSIKLQRFFRKVIDEGPGPS